MLLLFSENTLACRQTVHTSLGRNLVFESNEVARNQSFKAARFPFPRKRQFELGNRERFISCVPTLNLFFPFFLTSLQLLKGMSAGVLPSAAHVPLMRQQRQTFMQRCTFNFLSQTGDNFDAALDVTQQNLTRVFTNKAGFPLVGCAE